MLAIGPGSRHHVHVRMRARGAIAGVVGAVGLTACSLTGSPSAHTTVTPAAQSTTPGQTPAASSATPAHPATARPSAAATPGGTGAARASVTIAAVGDMMLGNTPNLPPSPATYLD